MTTTPVPLPSFFLLIFSLLQTRASVLSPSSAHTSSPPSCPSPIGFANTIIRAPLPSSPTLQIKFPFLLQHLLFYYTDTNVLLSEAAFASFCLDQCVGFQPDPKAGPAPSTSLPPSYVSNSTGPCLSFTVDMGKPYPPTANDTGLRWYCEGFDRYVAEDLSDYEPVDAPGSYMHALGVNRVCGGTYRAF